MKKNDKDAFLKSIIGTNPIKKNSKILKSVPERKKIQEEQLQETKKIEVAKAKSVKNIKKIENNNNFQIEKSQINKKLKKGRIPIDKKIDFHGMSVLDAEDLFLDVITNCYKENLRCILFITGKGILKKNGNTKFDEDIVLYHGKIRKNFSLWIQKEELKRYILNVEQAGIEYGADGAFFVYLRKQKF